MTDNMVKFIMPDGSEVSNDPRFDLEKAIQASFDSRPNRGSVGATHDEFQAQIQGTHPATLNSGQPGVGENAVPENLVADAYGALGSPGQQASVFGQDGDAYEPSVTGPDPVDSNAAVAEVQAKWQEKYEKAVENLESEGDPETPYGEWTGKQLKAEVARRNADGRGEDELLTIAKGMKVADVAAMLEADDENTSTGDENTPENKD